jgi:hypothetical protein
MNRKLLVSILTSLGIVVGAVGVAYAVGVFKATQLGFRQGGEGQAASFTMRVEAGMADGSSDLVPDVTNGYNPGGALSFSIQNTSDMPLQVTKIDPVLTQCGTYPNLQQCQVVRSNKNAFGGFTSGGQGTCAQYASFVAPSNFDNWPTIGAHSTLHVNGTDNNRLGVGMIHLASNTPSECQGATFYMPLLVTAAGTGFNSEP